MEQLTEPLAVLTPREIAEILQISYPYALEFIKHSGISYIRIGKQYRVSLKAFQKFLQEVSPRSITLSAVEEVVPARPKKKPSIKVKSNIDTRQHTKNVLLHGEGK